MRYAVTVTDPTADPQGSLSARLDCIIAELLDAGVPLRIAREEFEQKYVAAALRRTRYTKVRAAAILGVHRNTVLAKVGPSERALRKRERRDAKRSPNRRSAE
jgi:DNA-binding NtrC family response regulator